MSVQTISWVLDHSKSTATTRCVLIAIANHMSPDHEGWVYVDRVVAEANTTPDTYRGAVKWAIEAGELEREVRAGGGPRVPDVRRPNWFRFPLAAAPVPPDRGGSESGAVPPDLVRSDPPLSGGSSPPSSVGVGSRAVQEPSAETVPADGPDPVVAALVDRLRRRVTEHQGREPKVTAWAREIDLLMRRGSTEWARPEPIPADEIAAMIDFVFDRLATRRNGFCWADQIRSGAALRRQWDKLSRERDRAGDRGGSALVDDVLGAYGDHRPGDLFDSMGGNR